MSGSSRDKSSELNGLKAWVEPETLMLSVNETALRPNRGADGETRWVDCTS